MGWFIVLLVLVLGVAAFCVWYMRKDLDRAIAFLVKFVVDRITAKVEKLIGSSDVIEEKIKKRALQALDDAETYICDQIDVMRERIKKLEVIKKE